MSLQDDIARYAGRWNHGIGIDQMLTYTIASAIERDYWYTKLADLPEVTREGSHWSVDGQWLCAEARRDELARELFSDEYEFLYAGTKRAVDRIIELEGERS